MVNVAIVLAGALFLFFGWKWLWHERPSAEVERLLRQVEDVHHASLAFPAEDFSGPLAWIERESERLGVVGLVAAHRERLTRIED